MKSKRYPKEVKDAVIQEVKEVNDVGQVARRHNIHIKTLYRWLSEEKHQAWKNTPPNAKKTVTYTPAPQEFKQLETENDRLKRLLGEKDLEIAILQDLIKKTNPGYRTK